MRPRFPYLALTLLLATTSACTALVRLAAGPPDARARQAKLALDGAGQVTGVALEVDLYNPNPVDLAAARFDYRIEAGGAAVEGSVPAQGHLVQRQWAPVQLYIPVDRTSPVFAAIMAREPYVVTGALVLSGGMSGLAVGVSGEGVIAANDAPVGERVVRVAFAGRGGAL
jgi:hypothetical protein